MGQALYRKYRSKKLSEIIGQEHITNTLEKALQGGRISHAYLFTGPRGVGKTSVARILAHQINDIPYEDDRIHIDIVEIDAASNRRIDEIRDLREKVSVAPSSAKFKVYIIDEVHMLTKEAFNALLKTLEEPPAHVVFILATTDAHKLPETIVSRTQRYTFKPVSQDKVVAHLRQIAEAESIEVDDEALALLAAHGEGSFRDSISMLDQASSRGGALKLSDVQLLLGIPPADGIANLIDTLAVHDAPASARQLNLLYDQGFQAAAIAKILGQTLRRQLISGTSVLDGRQVLSLLARLLEVSSGYDPERLLEIILLQSAGADAITGRPPLPKKPSTPPPAAKPKPEPVAEPVLSAVADTVTGSMTMDLWPDVLTALKKQYNTLYGVVRMATPTFDGDSMELAFVFAFHQKRLSDPKNKKILADIMYDLSGQAMQIKCVVKKDDQIAKASNPADISAISDIFGGAEIIK